MKRYILKRILIMIPVFLGMTALVFFLSNMTPGSPVDAMVMPEMGVEDVEQLRHEMGLDQPIYVQYFKWLERLFHGNLGYSYQGMHDAIYIRAMRDVLAGMGVKGMCLERVE